MPSLMLGARHSSGALMRCILMMRHWSGALPAQMIVYIIRRLMQAALVMVVMSALVFAGIYLIGDPVAMMISPDASELEREAVRKALRPRPADVAAIPRCS